MPRTVEIDDSLFSTGLYLVRARRTRSKADFACLVCAGVGRFQTRVEGRTIACDECAGTGRRRKVGEFYSCHLVTVTHVTLYPVDDYEPEYMSEDGDSYSAAELYRSEASARAVALERNRSAGWSEAEIAEMS